MAMSTVSAATIANSSTNSTNMQHGELAVSLRYLYTTLMVCILAITIFGNAILVLVIYFHRRLCTTTNIFIANLAVGDMLLAAAVIPFDIDRLMRGYFAHSKTVCEFSSTLFLLSLPASAINLLIMTFERYCAVRFPLEHRAGSLFTKRRLVALLVCSWIYIAGTAMLPIMGWRSGTTEVSSGECLFYFDIEYAVFILVANFVCPLLLIIIMNICILNIARNTLFRKGTKKFSGQSQKFLARSTSVTSSTSNTANNKATKIIAILVGVFAFCWLPYILNTTINIVCRGCSLQEIGLATLILVYMNSAINPILYGMYKPQIRSTLKVILSNVCRKMRICKFKEKLDTERDMEETCL